VADVDRSCPLARRGEERVDDFGPVAEREVDRRPDIARPATAAGPVPGEVAGAVLEIGREDLVAGMEVERAGGKIDAGRRVLDEGEILRRAADVVGKR
jgi:hypothetical protein